MMFLLGENDFAVVKSEAVAAKRIGVGQLSIYGQSGNPS
jgi:hypothetical protein